MARPATARPFAPRPLGARPPITRISGQRSRASGTVWAWSRAVSVTSCPAPRSSSTIGSNRIGCGEFERSIQMRIVIRVSHHGAPRSLLTPAGEPKLTRRISARQTTAMSETPLHMMRSNRAIPAPVERALNAALSRGPGYEPTPIGPAFDDRSVSGYYIDFRAKTTAPVAGNAAALPAIQLIQLALGWWERHVGGDDAALSRFLELCAEIERRSVPKGGSLVWPVNVAVPKYGLVPGWSSALAQGQAGSVFVRAHLASGEDRYGELALRAVEPFLG